MVEIRDWAVNRDSTGQVDSVMKCEGMHVVNEVRMDGMIKYEPFQRIKKGMVGKFPSLH